MKPVLVLRPQPGNDATAALARASALPVVQCPLFAIEPVAWTAPSAAAFDYLLITSANALRHGGAELHAFRELAVLGVGETTAAAARDAGFRVAHVGFGGLESLFGQLPGRLRLLHLAGADHHRVRSPHELVTIIVYRATQLPVPALPHEPCVAMVHSARAGARLSKLARQRSSIIIAAISPAAAAACGTGWAAVEIADKPSDGALLALAARLCQD